MSSTAKWILGVSVFLIVLFLVAPFVWQVVFPSQSFGMMGYGPGHMRLGPGSMMGDRQFGSENYGYGMNPFGFLFMGLIQLGVLALLGLSIAALIKYLRKK